jgi:hypothetical protein
VHHELLHAVAPFGAPAYSLSRDFVQSTLANKRGWNFFGFGGPSPEDAAYAHVSPGARRALLVRVALTPCVSPWCEQVRGAESSVRERRGSLPATCHAPRARLHRFCCSVQRLAQQRSYTDIQNEWKSTFEASYSLCANLLRFDSQVRS